MLWPDLWWSLLLGFVRCLSLPSDGSLHLRVLKNDIPNESGLLPCADRARDVALQIVALGMASVFIWSRVRAPVSHSYSRKMAPGRQ